MEIINKVQAAILSQFGDIPDSKEFYLTGGTALSFFNQWREEITKELIK